MMLKKISTILGIAVVVAGAVTGFVGYENGIAKVSYVEEKDAEIMGEVNLLSNRLQQKIISDRIHNLQQRIWALEDRYGGIGVPSAPAEIRAEYRQLKTELEQAKNKINNP